MVLVISYPFLLVLSDGRCPEAPAPPSPAGAAHPPPPRKASRSPRNAAAPPRGAPPARPLPAPHTHRRLERRLGPHEPQRPLPAEHEPLHHDRHFLHQRDDEG